MTRRPPLPHTQGPSSDARGYHMHATFSTHRSTHVGANIRRCPKVVATSQGNGAGEGAGNTPHLKEKTKRLSAAASGGEKPRERTKWMRKREDGEGTLPAHKKPKCRGEWPAAISAPDGAHSLDRQPMRHALHPVCLVHALSRARRRSLVNIPSPKTSNDGIPTLRVTNHRVMRKSPSSDRLPRRNSAHHTNRRHQRARRGGLRGTRSAGQPVNSMPMCTHSAELKIFITAGLSKYDAAARPDLWPPSRHSTPFRN